MNLQLPVSNYYDSIRIKVNREVYCIYFIILMNLATAWIVSFTKSTKNLREITNLIPNYIADTN